MDLVGPPGTLVDDDFTLCGAFCLGSMMCLWSPPFFLSMVRKRACSNPRVRCLFSSPVQFFRLTFCFFVRRAHPPISIHWMRSPCLPRRSSHAGFRPAFHCPFPSFFLRPSSLDSLVGRLLVSGLDAFGLHPALLRRKWFVS